MENGLGRAGGSKRMSKENQRCTENTAVAETRIAGVEVVRIDG